MTVIVDKTLYPDFEKIRAVLQSGEAFPADIPYADYVEVLFPISKQGAVSSYAPLIYLTVFHANEAALAQLLKLPHCNVNITDITSSYALYFSALQYLFRFKDSASFPIYERMVNTLLAQPQLDLSLGVTLLRQTPMIYLARVGDAHLPLVKKIIEAGNSVGGDLYNSDPLMTSIQEQQWETATYLINSQAGAELLTRVRGDGLTAFNVACLFFQDSTKNTELITLMLQRVDVNAYEAAPPLFSALLNDDPAAALALTKILLMNGADPNLPNIYGDRALTRLFNSYAYACKMKDEQKKQIYYDLIILLFKYGVDPFFKVEEDKDFLAVMASNPNCMTLVMQLVNNLSEYLTADQMERMIGFACTNILNPIETNSHHQKFLNRMEALLTGNEDAWPTLLFKFKEEYPDDWRMPLPEDYCSQIRRKKILAAFVSLFQRGMLSPHNTFLLMNLLNSLGDTYKIYTPFLLSEYLIKSILEFNHEQTSKDKINALTRLFAMTNQLMKYSLEYGEGEGEYFADEFNDAVQRIIQITLLHAEGTRAHYAKFLFWLKDIDEKSLYPETQILILELKIISAYDTRDKKLFEQLFVALTAQLPANHISLRQYEYWRVSLLFDNLNVLMADEAKIGELSSAIEKLKERGIASEKLTYFTKTLGECKQHYQVAQRHKQIELAAAKRAADKKTAKKAAASPALESLSTVVIETASVTPSAKVADQGSASSSASSSAVGRLVVRQVFTSPAKPERARNKNVTVIQKQNAVKELAHKVDPTVKPPRYTQTQAYAYFKGVLQPGEQLKSLTYKGVDGICWVVCRPPADLPQPQRFKQKLTEATWVHTFAVSSGVSYEEDVFRIKLGRKDDRLHGSVYRPSDKKKTFFLVVFDTPWDHKQDLKAPPTQYIEADGTIASVASGSKKMHKASSAFE